MSLHSAPSLLHSAVLFALSAAAIVAAWAFLGAPVAMPQAPLAKGEKLYCVSYTPFRDSQTPLDETTKIEPWQIEEDLDRLALLTDCVRSYSIDFGLDRIPEIAQRHGLKVMLGLWLSNKPDKNRVQVETAIALANKYPDTIRAVVVGNEVLLRGDLSAAALADFIRGVKAKVPVPVTYADVWEFWLRNRDLASAVDFVTIHILPYWEDFPIAAERAAAHVEAIRRRVVDALPGKEVLIGEVGWPSAGRMREGALPSPVNQARVVQDVLALAKREQFRVNLIEAFDQPWKRVLEGTVGGHWGLLGARTRQFKFNWGEAVSNHPLWMWQAAGGAAFAALIFVAAWNARRNKPMRGAVLAAVAIEAAAAGIMFGWCIENVPIDSLGLGGWTRSLALAVVAFAAAPLSAAALGADAALPSFAAVLARRDGRRRDWVCLALGAVLIATAVLAIQVALGLVFDPRYRDFPFAPLTAAIVPLFVHGLVGARDSAPRGAAETAAAGILALSSLYIVFNEGFANWQSLWLCALLAMLAVTLARVRGAPG